MPTLRRHAPFLAVALALACSGGGSTTTNPPAPVANVTLSGGSGPINAGQTLTLTATLRDAASNTLTGRTITWSSSAIAIATVSGGVVTGVSAGTATITATAEGQSASISITVNAVIVPVATVTLTGGSGPLVPSQTLQLTATPRDGSGGALTGRTVTWSSAPGTVATVSGNGLVTALIPGTVTVTATSEGKSGSVQITVNPTPVATVTITATKTAFEVGDPAVTYTATPKDAAGIPLTGRTVVWGSSANAIATVSASGAVTALAPGNANITATSDGIVGSVAITVVPSSAPALLEQRVLGQQGLAIALASTVLQTQLYTLIVMGGADPNPCLTIPSGGSIKIPPNAGTIPTTMTYYFDGACTRPYMAETVTTYVNTPGGNFHVVATGIYTGPTGTPLGSILFDETANNINLSGGRITGTVNGLGVYTPPGGGQTVQLGLNCDFTAPSHNIGICQGGIQQNFPGLNTALGSVATLALDSSSTGVLSFTGGSSLKSGALNALLLTQPSATSMLVTGGTVYGAATAGGGAATFSLFPPTPTGWTVTDANNDMVFSIGLVDNATRTLTATIKRVSTGATLSTLSLDQSGTGTITYSNGLIAAVTGWMLGQ